jgi:hypothetical protein
MIHAGERLTFGLETLEENLVRDAGSNELQRYEPAQRSGLFRKPHLPHAAFT